MTSNRVTYLSAAFAMLAGVSWVAAALLQGSQPPGCVGEDCATASMRGVSEATIALVLVAGSALVVSCAGLVQVIRRHVGRSRLGIAGLAAVSVAIADLALAASLQKVSGADFELMPVLVVPGAVVLALGLALTSWAALRARVLPRWACVASLGGILVLLLVNEQTDRVLFAIPFGLAWIGVGASLALRRTQPMDACAQPLTARATTASRA